MPNDATPVYDADWISTVPSEPGLLIVNVTVCDPVGGLMMPNTANDW